MHHHIQNTCKCNYNIINLVTSRFDPICELVTIIEMERNSFKWPRDLRAIIIIMSIQIDRGFAGLLFFKLYIYFSHLI